MSSESDAHDAQESIKDIKLHLDTVDTWRHEVVDPHIKRMDRVADDTRALRTFMEETAGAAHLMCRFATAFRFTIRYIIIPAAVLVVMGNAVFGGSITPAWFLKLKALLL